MKKVLEHIQRQEPHIQTLIGKMIDAIRAGKDELSILQPKITKHEINWLRKNELEPEFNEQTQQWEIPLS
jgi:HAMP domain-containing protein